MIKTLSFFILAIALVGCGKMKSPSESFSALPQLPYLGAIPTSIPIPSTNPNFTPGSYFKIIKEVGSAKDTRVLEFQYLSSGKFIFTQTNFRGGDVLQSSFHKKSGTFREATGTITHMVTYDSCNDLKPVTTYVTGDRSNMINANLNGNSLSFYSYLIWGLPADISRHITEAVEDVGCNIFKD